MFSWTRYTETIQPFGPHLGLHANLWEYVYRGDPIGWPRSRDVIYVNQYESNMEDKNVPERLESFQDRL